MRERRAKVPVSFDGLEVEAFADESVLQTARRVGVTIPSLCFLEGLSVWGGCRLCVVEIAEDHPQPFLRHPAGEAALLTLLAEGDAGAGTLAEIQNRYR